MNEPFLKNQCHTSLRVQQNLMLSQNMQQALHVLKLPIQDLATWLEEFALENPLLEITRSSPLKSTPLIDPYYEKAPSLYQFLMEQVEKSFYQARIVAREIIGNLDINGFLQVSLEEIAQTLKEDLFYVEEVLAKVQQLDPIGIAARNARESLLIQLRSFGKERSLAWQILEKHYDLFLKQENDKIAKKLATDKESILNATVQDIKPLDPFPGRRFSSELNRIIQCDLIISYEDDYWSIKHPKDGCPSISFCDEKNSLMKKMPKPLIHRYIASGNWLFQTLSKRREILEAIAKYIIEKQKLYLMGEERFPAALTLTAAAENLGLNLSTLSRAVSDKYVETPLGFLPLSHFFPQKAGKNVITTSSVDKAKALIKELIEQENKKTPHPDEILTKLLKTKGVFCKRRTVAKYRKELNIPSSSRRAQK